MSYSSADRMMRDAVAAYKSGRLDHAEKRAGQILARQADYAPALHLSGVIAAETGRPALGIEFLHKFVALRPENLEMANYLGLLLRTERRYGEAAAVFDDAVRRKPDFVNGWINLGLVHLDQTNPAKAVTCFERALLLEPNAAIAHYNLAMAFEGQGEIAKATSAYMRATVLAPNLAAAHFKLGHLFHMSGNEAKAAICFRRAAEAEPDSALGQLSLATALLDEGEAAKAEIVMRRLIVQTPDNAQAHRFLGDILKQLGRFDDAIESFEHAIALDPRAGAAYLGIVSAKKMQSQDRPLIATLLDMVNDGGLPMRERINLHFALGKAFDDLGDYAAAFHHYDSGNRLRAGDEKFDRAAHKRWIDSLIARFTPELLAKPPASQSASELPVLVLGMMRSGTTLVEQILSNHFEIGAGGELSYWGDKAAMLGEAGAAGLDRTSTDKTIAEYQALLGAAALGKSRITDKMPHNFLHIGLIHRLFPRARIIHCRRNPVDTCLSIYFSQLRGHSFAHDPADIVFYYREYKRLMAHWRKVIPAGSILEIDYEALVEDREPTSRAMIAFCGLAWNDACLEPQTNRRTVRTASMWQARQPVYKSSVERWRRYEPWLGEFRQLLCGNADD